MFCLFKIKKKIKNYTHAATKLAFNLSTLFLYSDNELSAVSSNVTFREDV